MKRTYLWLIVLTAASACSSGGLRETVYGRRGDVVVVNDDGGKKAKSRGPRALNVPRGHYPPAGQCRLWYEGRPPGHQPRPTSCNSLVGRVPAGAFVLYNARAYDMDYDWRREKKNGSRDVPEIIINLKSRG